MAMDEKVSSTAERLTQIMHEQHLRQVDILNLVRPYCEIYGTTFTKGLISQYVHGLTRPTQDRLFVLATVLDVSEGWLMGYDVSRQRKRTNGTQSEQLKDILRWIDEQATMSDIVQLFDSCVQKLKK